MSVNPCFRILIRQRCFSDSSPITVDCVDVDFVLIHNEKHIRKTMLFLCFYGNIFRPA